MPRTIFKNGIEVPVFDHSTRNVFDALGYNEQEVHDLIDKVNKQIASTHVRSITYEWMYNNLTKQELIVLLEVLRD